MNARILIAEDDPRLLEVVRRYLVREGYQVDEANDGRAAVDTARRAQPDLLVLDLMLPKVDGWDVCRILRAESSVPILVLTARSTENDMLLGLDLGADDYMTKPFSPPELVARVRALLRRSRTSRQQYGGGPISLGPVTVDQARHEVTVHGALVACTPAEFAILAALIERPGQVLSRAQLLLALHGGDQWIDPRTVDTHIKNLRRKIELDSSAPQFLLTVHGVGYKADHSG